MIRRVDFLGWAAAACGVAGLVVAFTQVGGDDGNSSDPFWTMVLLGVGAVGLTVVALRQPREERRGPWTAVAGLVAGLISLIVGAIGIALFAASDALVDLFS